MSNYPEIVTRTSNTNPCFPLQCCRDHKKVLITMVAIAALAAIIVGTLTLLASSHTWLNGLSVLGTPGGISFVVVGSATLVMIALSACCFNKHRESKSNSLEKNTHIDPTISRNLGSSEPSETIHAHTFQNSGEESKKPYGQTLQSSTTNSLDLIRTEEIKEQQAVIKIQSAFRRHIAHSALKKLRNEQQLRKQEDAALILQSVCRTHLAQSQLQILQNESEQKKLDELKAQQLKQTIQPLPQKFLNYTAEVYFSSSHKESFPIRSEDDVEHMVKKISDEITQKHTSISIYFDSIITFDKERKEMMECYQKAPSATHLQFSMPFNSSFLNVEPKPLTTEELGDGTMRRTFANGIIETFKIENRVKTGTRLYPDGKQEHGRFGDQGLSSGYRVGIDKQIEFCNPESLVTCNEECLEESTLKICEIEGKLLVLEDRYIGEEFVYNNISTVSVYDVLIEASERGPGFHSEGKSISKVLLHKDFESQVNPFLEYALGNDESGTPRLYSFSNAAILDVLEAGSKIKAIDPLNIIDPASKRNIFLQALYWNSTELLKKLIELFPQAFEAVGQEIVAEFLLGGHSIYDFDKISQPLNKRHYDFLENAKLDAYHKMWLQVAKKEKPNENFTKEFTLLSSEQQRILYDAAFTYNNPYIYEPADVPVRADQYSINLMWINKSKMPAQQEFLLGDGSSPEQQRRDFQKRFVIPVAKWAKAHPGSPINIWVDSEMATPEAIERSRQEIEKALEGSVHGIVQFRDVRSIEIVGKNASVFDSSMPIYFRVDLLRAIAADHVLRSKETKYFVYGDIDMKPLKGQQLFDQKTVSFLDDFGIVMAKGGHLGFENGFQILNGENHQCLTSHRKVIIDLSIEMALERPKAIKEQQIYDTYPAMITHLLDADGRFGKLNLSEKKQKLFGPKVFRFDRFGITAHDYLPLGDGKIELRQMMPRKPVRLPPSHF